MKANELRIGNWINRFGIPEQVVPNIIVGFSQIEQAGKICIDLTPISLTEEWLLKFGLKRNSDGSIFSFIETQQIGDDLTIRNDIQEWSLWFGDAMMIDLKIEYVHQLQNLFFALTENELELK